VLAAIAAVPRRMTNTFLSMYRAQLQILLSAMPPPANAATLEAELRQKIKLLEDYLATLN
jgi:hypothetical protein